MASRPLTLTQLARAVGVRVDDVRFYEKPGLLQKPRRWRGSSGGLAYHREPTAGQTDSRV
jgi:DNA-binding transcriptional MerR regulator